MVDQIETALEQLNWHYVRLSRLRYANSRVKTGDPRWLERPFAYEIYHQLRCIWDRESEFDCVIQAEVFKHYQEIRELDKMPDLLIHLPDSTEKNLAVVEIKLASNRQKNLICDLNKLGMFQRILKYKTLVEVIIGANKEIEVLQRKIERLNRRNGANIDVLFLSIDDHKVQRQSLTWREIEVEKRPAFSQKKT